MMLNEFEKKKNRLPKIRRPKGKVSFKGASYKVTLIASFLLLIGLILYSMYYRYGYFAYAAYCLMSFVMFLVGTLMIIPVFIFCKEQTKKSANTAKFRTWFFRTIQHAIVAIGSVLIYFVAVGVHFTSDSSPTLLVYSFLSAIATYFGNKHYIRYYQVNRLIYPQAKEAGLKLLITAVTLFCAIGGGTISYLCIRDIPHLGNPKQITIYDITVKYKRGTGKSTGYYRIFGNDIHGNTHEFEIGTLAVDKIEGHTSAYLDITYLPNTNIMLNVE